jgi:hypothetical protein
MEPAHARGAAIQGSRNRKPKNAAERRGRARDRVSASGDGDDVVAQTLDVDGGNWMS